MSAHTPGPWEIHPHQPNIVHAPAAGIFIADVFSGHQASEANTLAIAAVPDMIAALRLVFAEVLGPAPHSEFSFLPPVVVDQLRAVINKATGGKA